MLSFITVLTLLLTPHISYAGWIVGSDSNESGVLNISRNKKTGDIQIFRCENIESQVKSECKLEESYELSYITQAIDNLQLAGASFMYAGPFLVALIVIALPGTKVGAMITLGLVISMSGMIKIVSMVPGALNLFRLYDYKKTTSISFLDDDAIVLTFPKDSIKRIINELVPGKGDGKPKVFAFDHLYP